MPGRQTDGLVTDRSGSDQERRIDTVFTTEFKDLWSVSLRGEALTPQGRHREDAFVQDADLAFSGGLFRALKRQVRVDVLS